MPPRTCAQSLAFRHQVSPPRPRPALPVPVQQAEPPTSERLEALLSHSSLWAFQRRAARQYLADNPTAEALVKVVRRLEELIRHSQRHTQPLVRAMLNRIHNPAYAALYEPPLS